MTAVTEKGRSRGDASERAADTAVGSTGRPGRTSLRPTLFETASVLSALSVLAVAAPLLDVVSKNAEFLVAHRLSSLAVIALATAVTWVPAVVVVVGFWISARWLGDRAHLLAFAGASGLLASLTALPPSQKLVADSVVGALLVSAAIGGALAALVAKWTIVRSFVGFLSIGLLVFPLRFLFLSPVSGIVLPSSVEGGDAKVSIEAPHDVVLVVLDEMDRDILLDSAGDLDAVRFPNFARLADDSHWFGRATAVDNSTAFAVPAIVSGNYPQPGLLPTYQDYPETLFSILAPHFHLHVSEVITDLLSEEWDLAVSRDGRTRDGRIGVGGELLFRDLGIIYLHVVLPAELADDLLPSVSSGWKAFGDPVPGTTSDSSPSLDRASTVEDFLGGLEKRSRPTFNFLHVLLPHHPYEFAPTGEVYAPAKGLDGLVDDPKTRLRQRWIDDQTIVDLARYRYLLQVGFTDHLIGRLIDRLKEEEIYDDALVVVTADHGVSFRAGDSIRRFSPQNYRELLNVPMFVKLPGQRRPVRSDRFVESIDIAPTVLDVLQATPMPETDGRSMISASFADRVSKSVTNHGGAIATVFDYDDVTTFRTGARQYDILGSGTPLSEVSLRSVRPELLGRRLDDFAVTHPGIYELEHDQADILPSVDPSGAFVPMFQSGRLLSPVAKALPIELVFVVGGTVAATAQLTGELGDRPEFRALLPASTLESGRNQISIFVVEDGPDGPSLAAVRAPGRVGRISQGERPRSGEGVEPTRVRNPLDLLATATEATVAWPGRPEWSLIEASRTTLSMHAPEVWGELSDSRVVVELQPGEHQLHGIAQLREASNFPVVLGVDLRYGDGPRVGVFKKIVEPGRSAVVDQFVSIPAGTTGELGVYCRTVGRARRRSWRRSTPGGRAANNSNAGLLLRGLELRSWSPEPE